jgi:hypothetical protein
MAFFSSSNVKAGSMTGPLVSLELDTLHVYIESSKIHGVVCVDVASLDQTTTPGKRSDVTEVRVKLQGFVRSSYHRYYGLSNYALRKILLDFLLTFCGCL